MLEPISMTSIKLRLGSSQEFSEAEEEERSLIASLPEEFDWREARPECISDVQAQGSCGSCYAFASAAMLAERNCISKGLTSAEVLSTEMIISCDNMDFGCNGGHLDATMDFLSEEAIPVISCDRDKYAYMEKALESCPLYDD